MNIQESGIFIQLDRQILELVMALGLEDATPGGLLYRNIVADLKQLSWLRERLINQEERVNELTYAVEVKKSAGVGCCRDDKVNNAIGLLGQILEVNSPNSSEFRRAQVLFNYISDLENSVLELRDLLTRAQKEAANEWE